MRSTPCPPPSVGAWPPRPARFDPVTDTYAGWNRLTVDQINPAGQVVQRLTQDTTTNAAGTTVVKPSFLVTKHSGATQVRFTLQACGRSSTGALSSCITRTYSKPWAS